MMNSEEIELLCIFKYLTAKGYTLESVDEVYVAIVHIIENFEKERNEMLRRE